MNYTFLSRNKIPECILMIMVTLLSFSVSQNGIEAKEMPVKSGFAEINDTKIYYEVIGEGHPLVLIHGGFMDRRMWDNDFKRFAKNFKVIRYDIRGYGKSETPQNPFSHIDDLFQLLKFLNIENAYILGLSRGGQIAIDFTIAHPDMVSALLPVASAPTGYPYTHTEKWQHKYLEVFKAAEKEGLDKAAELVMKLPFFVPLESDTELTLKMRGMIKDNFENLTKQRLYIWPSPPAFERLSEIKVPVLSIVGDHDVQDIIDSADALVEKITGAKKEIIQGAAHHVNLEKPDEFYSIVLSFLNKLEISEP